MRLLPLLVLPLFACNTDPGEVDAQVGYRSPLDDGPDNGERGTVIISEVLWSGSIDMASGDPVWDKSDVFVEIRNQGNRPVNLSGWYLLLDGARMEGWRFPDSDKTLAVGEFAYAAAKTSGCFPEPDWVIEGLSLPFGDPFELTLRDADERLMEPIGSETMPPFAGGYDLVRSRSMERVILMFGGRGTEPHMWHHHTKRRDDEGPSDIGINDDRIKESCRARTLASPGRHNSQDYSGAYSTGTSEE